VTDSPLASHFEDNILTLTLNCPERRNSLSEAMIDALHKAFLEAGEDKEVRAIILAAEGHVFCAGHDLKEMTAARQHGDRGREYYCKIMDKCASMMIAMTKCPKPVIARVDGIATAAGCQLVATCDLAVASTNSKFSTPGVHIGLFCSTPMVALSRNVSRKHAMEMLLLGEMVEAEKAAQIGLVNRVCAPEDVTGEALKIARTIAGKSQVTVKFGKEAFYQQIDMNLEDAYAHTCDVMVQNMLANDAEEGINAFIEKRKPEWNN